MGTFKVAIDGPAGAGKSTIAKAAARQLKFVYIDTGAMYRAVGLAAVREGINPNTDIKEVEALLPKVEIDISHGDKGQEIFLNGENVSKEIRMPEISVAASDVSKIPAVRKKLLGLQRSIAEKTDVIMDGRDIGTVVLPDAELKIFLTASVEERAMRRYRELCEKGIESSFDEEVILNGYVLNYNCRSGLVRIQETITVVIDSTIFNGDALDAVRSNSVAHTILKIHVLNGYFRSIAGNADITGVLEVTAVKSDALVDCYIFGHSIKKDDCVIRRCSCNSFCESAKCFITDLCHNMISCNFSKVFNF